jgi:hypothetical protein
MDVKQCGAYSYHCGLKESHMSAVSDERGETEASEDRHNTFQNGVFWDVTSCGSCKNRRFGGT